MGDLKGDEFVKSEQSKPLMEREVVRLLADMQGRTPENFLKHLKEYAMRNHEDLADSALRGYGQKFFEIYLKEK